MKQLKLQKLVLTNFKGIKHFELNATGEDVQVFGDNATGKTTIPDGFNWLLFDKDSNNKKDFAIKTLIDGKEVHNLNHEVEATLLVDGKPLTLKKSFYENWTKKRGSATKEFTGHKTDHFIDGVPVKKKEYTEKVASIVDEDIFKLLTSPSYFNEQLHWKKRRDLLLEIAGDVTDEEVFGMNKDLEKLAEVLNGRSIDDHKKVIAAKRKEINEELDRIPIRIDEINRGLPDVSGLNKESINADLQKIATDIDAKQEQINSIKSGSEVNKAKSEISDIDLKISNIKNEHTQEGQQLLFSLKARMQEEQSNINIQRSELEYLKASSDQNNKRIKDNEELMNKLRDEYVEENKKEFNHESECVCPTCEQDLPQDQVLDIEKKFNLNKAKKLEEINEKGKYLKEQNVSLTEDVNKTQSKVDKTIEQGKEKASEIKRLEEKIQDAESNVKPITENASYNKLMQERQALERSEERRVGKESKTRW